MPDFLRLVTSLPIGQPVTAVVLRAGKEMKFDLEPVERGELNLKERELKQWGLTVRDLSFLTSREMKRTNQLGVLVSSVRPGGPSGEAKPAIEPKDVLIEINGKALSNLQELLTTTLQVTDGKKEPVPVIASFERDSQRY